MAKVLHHSSEIHELAERVSEQLSDWKKLHKIMEQIPETDANEAKTCLLQIHSAETFLVTLEDLARTSLSYAQKSLLSAKRESRTR